MPAMSSIQHVACACGQLRLELEGEPIASVECCCDSCREAGARMARLPGARPVLSEYGTTHLVMQRKDRVRFVAGADQLRQFRLAPDAPTRRVVAACCNTPVFLEFESGHWLSLYGGLWREGALPPLQMRTMAGDLDDASALPDDVPNSKGRSLPFIARLLTAWIAMRFRVPKIAVAGDLHL
ncbi:GFA family protein [Marilutibacter maris]|nr:DUF6151 family protein [Lysobacter maris]